MKKSFKAAPGVATVNGSAVPEDGSIQLTETEALYDLAHGNITPDPQHEVVEGGAEPALSKRRKPSGAP